MQSLIILAFLAVLMATTFCYKSHKSMESQEFASTFINRRNVYNFMRTLSQKDSIIQERIRECNKTPPPGTSVGDLQRLQSLWVLCSAPLLPTAVSLGWERASETSGITMFRAWSLGSTSTKSDSLWNLLNLLSHCMLFHLLLQFFCSQWFLDFVLISTRLI